MGYVIASEMRVTDPTRFIPGSNQISLIQQEPNVLPLNMAHQNPDGTMTALNNNLLCLRLCDISLSIYSIHAWTQ